MVIGIFKNGAFASGSRSSGKNNARSRSGSVTDPESDDEIVEVPPQVQEHLCGWAYVGSHNFTPSAWGNLSGSAFNPIINVGSPDSRTSTVTRITFLGDQFRVGNCVPAENREGVGGGCVLAATS